MRDGGVGSVAKHRTARQGTLRPPWKTHETRWGPTVSPLGRQAPPLLLGIPRASPRSSSNGHVEASKRRNVSCVPRLGGVKLFPVGDPTARVDVSTLQADQTLVNVQRDEGGELRHEAVPDAFPAGGSETRFLVPGEGHGLGWGR